MFRSRYCEIAVRGCAESAQRHRSSHRIPVPVDKPQTECAAAKMQPKKQGGWREGTFAEARTILNPHKSFAQQHFRPCTTGSTQELRLCVMLLGAKHPKSSVCARRSGAGSCELLARCSGNPWAAHL